MARRDVRVRGAADGSQHKGADGGQVCHVVHARVDVAACVNSAVELAQHVGDLAHELLFVYVAGVLSI
eukprot:158793-Chlamydomonas_euryale.AAC.6